MRVLKEMLCGIKNILADGGYRGETITEVKRQFGYYSGCVKIRQV